MSPRCDALLQEVGRYESLIVTTVSFVLAAAAHSCVLKIYLFNK